MASSPRVPVHQAGPQRGPAALWRNGFVPTESLSKMSREEQISRDEEYGFAVTGPLPATPKARIRWDDGSTMRAPVISDQDFLASASWRIHWSRLGLSTVVMTLTVVRR